MASDDVTLPEGTASPDGTSIEPPRHLGRYTIGHVLGTGGMGIVLAAHDPELDRQVALKLMHHGEPDDQRRLLREAQAMARLRHPNVITVHDVGVCDGRVFVAMELVEGTTLRAWLRASSRPWREIMTRFIAAGHGLAAAHAAGIVHRDFKADNVLVGKDGSVRVADFGLAGTDQDHADGVVMGTPAYMAPEQHEGGVALAPADQFAFAATLWEALSGTRPFVGGTGDELSQAKRDHKLVTPSGKAPRWAFALLRRALSPDPAARHPSMEVLVRGLERGMRRRRIAITAAVAAGLVGVTAVAAVTLAGGHAGPSCKLAAGEVARAWNPAARAAITTAFSASKRPHAAATLSRVLAGLDAHAAAIAAGRVDACKATHERGERSAVVLDRRMACLDQKLDAMAALVALLGRADDATIDAAFPGVVALPDAEECTGQLAGTDIAPAAIREQVAALRRRLADANALRLAGKAADSVTAYDAAITEVRALGYAPLIAEALAGRAEAIAEIGDKEASDAALAAYQEAATAAAAAGNDTLIASAWVGQLGVLTDGEGKPADALERLSFAEVAVARAGGTAVREHFLAVRADIMAGLGRYAEARTDLQSARRSLEQRGAGESYEAARLDTRMGTVLWNLGENQAALDLDRRTLALWNETLGPDHPKVGQVLNNLAIRLDDADRYEEARTLLQRSLSIKERTLGPESPSVPFTLNNLARVAGHMGDRATQVALLERALAIREKVLPPDHPDLALSISNLATARNQQGRHEEALALHQRALAIRERLGGPDHPSVASSLNYISTVLLDLGRFDESLAAAQRSVAIMEKRLGPEHPDVADALTRLGDIYLTMKKLPEACAAFARSVAIVEKAQGPEHSDVPPSLAGLASCKEDSGDHAGAIADADRAIAIAVKVGIPVYFRARARFVKVRALYARPATRAQAALELKTTLEEYQGAPEGTRREVEEIEAWRKSHP